MIARARQQEIVTIANLFLLGGLAKLASVPIGGVEAGEFLMASISAGLKVSSEPIFSRAKMLNVNLNPKAYHSDKIYFHVSPFRQ
jgi:hypothetical protein